MNRTFRPRLIALAALLSVALACGEDRSPTSPQGSGTLTVRLTDATVDDVAEVNVHITGLTVKRSGAPVDRIANDLGTVDLLTLAGTSMLLATTNVAAGQYEFVQVDLSEEGSSIVMEGSTEELPLSIASDEIKVLGGFTVQENGTTTLLLDFDARASLQQLGNGDWLLTPVIVLANADQT